MRLSMYQQHDQGWQHGAIAALAQIGEHASRLGAMRFLAEHWGFISLVPLLTNYAGPKGCKCTVAQGYTWFT